MIVRTDVRAGALTVYGSETCGWTKKQLAYLEKKGIPFTFVDCDRQSCPEFVSGFPTLKMDGQIKTGYQEI